MGVRGLSTFFNNNPSLSKRYELHDTPVIIDGNNLIHRLYFSSKVDCIYGGDYNKYAKTIRRYFQSYAECNIKPMVIFDGGYDKSDRKFRTCLVRAKERLTLTKHIAKFGECSAKVFPINAQEVFRNVLTELNISFAQCDFEADDQVTALANYFNCPVLSDDSDFYIYDLKSGFIRLSYLDMDVCVGQDNKYKYLSCLIYYIDTFLSYFPGIDRRILPLFSTLIGNDYVNTKDFSKFFSNIQLPKQKYQGLSINLQQKKIIGLLSWFRYCDFNDGVKQVLCHLKKNRREYIESVIKKSVEGYVIQKCNLTCIFEKQPHKFEEIFSETKMFTACGEPLVVPFVIAFHEGRLPSFFLNALGLHRIFLLSQVEDTSQDSAYVCSRYIRKIIYGILLQHDSASLEIHDKECLCEVEEYDRRSGKLEREKVPALYRLENGTDVPTLNNLYSMDDMELHHFMLQALNQPENYASQLPDHLKLFISSINFWLRNCLSKPSEEFIYALALNIIYFSVLTTSDTAKEYSNSHNENLKKQMMFSNVKCTSVEEKEFALKNLKKYIHQPTLNGGNPLIISIVHCFSELQTCILYITYLNVLLKSPFNSPKLHECVMGTFLYNITKDIMQRKVPSLFVSELLGRESPLCELFESVKDKMLENVPSSNYIKIDRSQFNQSKSSRKKKIKKTGAVLTDSLNRNLCDSSNCNNIENLFSEVFI